jgi:hypothetical protein
MFHNNSAGLLCRLHDYTQVITSKDYEMRDVCVMRINSEEYGASGTVAVAVAL